MNCNISNIISPSGSSDGIIFSLPVPGKHDSIVIGVGTMTINSGASYPSQNISLVTKIYNHNTANCRLWYSADNGTTTDRQTYLENDFLPTLFGSNVTWNGYLNGIDISFNFTYEIL